VPTYTESTALSYTHRLTEALQFVGRVDNQYVGPLQDVTYKRNNVPGYLLTNARFGVASDNWTATLFINNIADKQAILANTNSLTVNTPIFTRIATNQPRTIGVDLTYRLGGPWQ